MPSVAAPELLRPSFCWIPEYGETLGPEVGELATMAGFPPDPEQQMALDATFAMDPADPYRSAVRDVAICAPRQNLKTGYLKQAALGWLYVLELRLIVWSAHEFSTAQEAFRDMCQLIESCPDLDREVLAVHRGSGVEAIELTRDRRLKFKARTKSGGRGLTGDRIVLDEAMYLTASHLGALRPTLRAVKDPQLVLAGSAGLVESEVWRGYRDRGRAGGDPSTVWLEWGDPDPSGCHEDGCDHAPAREGCALDDRARWWATNSALGRRIDEETLAADRRNLPAAEFARETLGWWDDPDASTEIMFGGRWPDLADPSAERGSPVSFGVAVAPDREWAAIAVSWRRPDGAVQVMVSDYHRGTDWITARAKELRGQWGGTFLASTAAKGLTPHAVEPSAAEQALAHTSLDDLVMAGRLRHGNQPALNIAVAGAQWRPFGDTRTFDRKGSTDITPLDAAALAVHGLVGSARRPGRFVSM